MGFSGLIQITHSFVGGGSKSTECQQLFSSNNSIYIGLFFDYGINDLYDGEEFEDLVNYSNDIPSEFTYNTILGTSNASEVKLNAYGVKLKYSLGI